MGSNIGSSGIPGGVIGEKVEISDWLEERIILILRKLVHGPLQETLGLRT